MIKKEKKCEQSSSKQLFIITKLGSHGEYHLWLIPQNVSKI